MTWIQTRRYAWELTTDGFDGKAFLKETNSGYIASITVKNTEFDMALADEREFFERKKKAVQFLNALMEKHSYE